MNLNPVRRMWTPPKKKNRATGLEMALNAKYPEHALQSLCVSHFRNHYALADAQLFAIPNGGRRDAREGARLKREGVAAGVPDLCLVLSNGHVVWIEIKAGKNGLTASQKRYHAELARLGHQVHIVRSLGQFAAVLNFHVDRVELGPGAAKLLRQTI